MYANIQNRNEMDGACENASFLQCVLQVAHHYMDYLFYSSLLKPKIRRKCSDLQKPSEPGRYNPIQCGRRQGAVPIFSQQHARLPLDLEASAFEGPRVTEKRRWPHKRLTMYREVEIGYPRAGQVCCETSMFFDWLGRREGERVNDATRHGLNSLGIRYKILPNSTEIATTALRSTMSPWIVSSFDRCFHFVKAR